jgi:hypothetical protein
MAVGFLMASLSAEAKTPAVEDVDVLSTAVPQSAPASLESKQQCLSACREGITAIEAFCRTVPDPRVRTACWAARFSLNACTGFCHWYF